MWVGLALFDPGFGVVIGRAVVGEQRISNYFTRNIFDTAAIGSGKSHTSIFPCAFRPYPV
jgi:hypothetical protein